MKRLTTSEHSRMAIIGRIITQSRGLGVEGLGVSEVEEKVNRHSENAI